MTDVWDNILLALGDFGETVKPAEKRQHMRPSQLRKLEEQELNERIGFTPEVPTFAQELKDTSPADNAFLNAARRALAGGIESVGEVRQEAKDFFGNIVAPLANITETEAEKTKRASAETAKKEEAAAAKRATQEAKIAGGEKQLGISLGLTGGRAATPTSGKAADVKPATELDEAAKKKRLNTLLLGMASGLLDAGDAPIGESILRAALGGIKAEKEETAAIAQAKLDAAKEQRAINADIRAGFKTLPNGKDVFINIVNGRPEIEPVAGIGRTPGSGFEEERMILDKLQENAQLRTVFGELLEHDSLQDIATQVQMENPTASAADIDKIVQARKELTLMNSLKTNPEQRLAAINAINNYAGGVLSAEESPLTGTMLPEGGIFKPITGK